MKTGHQPMGWPAAVTLIAAIVGAAATTLAWAVVPSDQLDRNAQQGIVSARELGEVKARLTALEDSNRLLRTELRNDIKEVREMVRQLIDK